MWRTLPERVSLSGETSVAWLCLDYHLLFSVSSCFFRATYSSSLNYLCLQARIDLCSTNDKGARVIGGFENRRELKKRCTVESPRHRSQSCSLSFAILTAYTLLFIYFLSKEINPTLARGTESLFSVFFVLFCASSTGFLFRSLEDYKLLHLRLQEWTCLYYFASLWLCWLCPSSCSWRGSHPARGSRSANPESGPSGSDFGPSALKGKSVRAIRTSLGILLAVSRYSVTNLSVCPRLYVFMTPSIL